MPRRPHRATLAAVFPQPLTEPRKRYRVPRFGPAPHLCYLYRKVAELTQHEAAERVGCSPRAWQYYEAGERRPPRRIIAAMLRVLNDGVA